MSKPQVIEAKNLSEAWAKTFLLTVQQPVNKPLFNLTVGFPTVPQDHRMWSSGDNETEAIRIHLNQQLKKLGKSQIDTVASTIFPISLWDRDKPSDALFERYKDIWSRIKKCRPNSNGTYFQRMIAYGWEHDKAHQLTGVNQLQHVITTYVDKKNPRRSAYYAAITDPLVDHTHQRQRGFPCLQHVHFVVDEGNENLTVTGIYATQLILEKAYGNYLGLYRLGLFMAHHMGLKLVRVQCNASRAKYSDATKETLQPFQTELEEIIKNDE